MVSPSPRFSLSHPLPRDLRGSGGLGREAGRPTEGGWQRELGGLAELGSERRLRDAKEGAIRGRLGIGSWTGVPSLPKGARGPLPGEPPPPPPSSSQPREQRVWEARPGSGSGGGGRQAVGAGRAPPHISSRGRNMESSFQPTLH